MGALTGMLLGGAFGFGAGQLAPGLFQVLFPLGPVIEQPVGAAIVIGASGGVLCGGALAAFVLMLTRFDAWIRSRRSSTGSQTAAN